MGFAVCGQTTCIIDADFLLNSSNWILDIKLKTLNILLHKPTAYFLTLARIFADAICNFYNNI